jgi:hypothetical protein
MKALLKIQKSKKPNFSPDLFNIGISSRLTSVQRDENISLLNLALTIDMVFKDFLPTDRIVHDVVGVSCGFDSELKLSDAFNITACGCQDNNLSHLYSPEHVNCPDCLSRRG